MITFYLVRHGQTLFNLMLRIQGSCDSPLTEKGINDARRAGKALAQIEFDRAYCSSSERAIDTAELILENRMLQAKPLKGLKEFGFGLIDGSTLDESVKEREARRYTRDYTDIGGDSAETMKQRIIDTLQGIISECNDGDTVLLVSHGNFTLYLLETLFDIDPEAYKESRRNNPGFCVPNGGITKFTYDEGRFELCFLPRDPDEFNGGK